MDQKNIKFQSTRPAWGETAGPVGIPSTRSTFQSTRPAWGETSLRDIHAKLAEISIHSPRVGRDTLVGRITSSQQTFQSTRPAWGETLILPGQTSATQFQSTRPAWGETKEDQ